MHDQPKFSQNVVQKEIKIKKINLETGCAFLRGCFKKTENEKCWQECREKGILIVHC